MKLSVGILLAAGVSVASAAEACRPKVGDTREIIACQQSNAGPDHGLEAIISRLYLAQGTSLQIQVSSQSIAGPRTLFNEETAQSETTSVTTFDSENVELSFISDTPVKAAIVLKKNANKKIQMKCKHLPQPRC